MRSHSKANKRGYVCERQPGEPNCGSMSVRADHVEELVSEMIFAAVDDEGLRDAIMAREAPEDGLFGAIANDERAMEELSKDFYVERLLQREEFFAARGALLARLEANRAKLAQRSRSRVLGDAMLGGVALRKAWEAGTLEWRRAVVGTLLDHVDILPGKPGRVPCDPSRVRPVWRY